MKNKKALSTRFRISYEDAMNFYEMLDKTFSMKNYWYLDKTQGKYYGYFFE